MASQVVVASGVQSEVPQTWSSSTTQWQDALSRPGFVAKCSAWHYLVTLVLGVVVYDQGKLFAEPPDLVVVPA